MRAVDGGLTIRALCSGYGGLEIAVEQLTGARVVDHAESDERAAAVHEAHWPGLPNLGQLRVLGNGVVPLQAMAALRLLSPT